MMPPESRARRPFLFPPAARFRVVTPATEADLAFVVFLQKRHADALGFIPRMALLEKIERGQVAIARAGGEPAGFLHHGSLARPEVRVFQAAVLPGERRRGLGMALVDDLVDRAAAAGAGGVSLRCLSFLEANRFWRAAGFRLLTTEPGGKGTLNVWVKKLERGRGGRFTFSSRIHPCPACGAATTDTWVRGARRLALCPACIASADTN